MSAQATSQRTRAFPVMGSRESRIALGVIALAILAMAVDHLIGDDPGLEDPAAFAVSSALSLALAALMFGRIVPRAISADPHGERAARDGLISSIVAVVPGVTTIWLGLPFILAGAGLALGISSRGRRPSTRATAAVVIGALTLLGGAGTYLVQAIDKLA